MLFFVFKQKTASEMRISDWSSDVCSSDLTAPSRPSSLPVIIASVYRSKSDRAASSLERGSRGWPYGHLFQPGDARSQGWRWGAPARLRRAFVDGVRGVRAIAQSNGARVSETD